MMNEVSAFCAGYITALNTAGVEWEYWLVHHSIHCCSIEFMRDAVDKNKVNIIVRHPGGKREEFFMVERPNMYDEPEWVKE